MAGKNVVVGLAMKGEIITFAKGDTTVSKRIDNITNY